MAEKCLPIFFSHLIIGQGIRSSKFFSSFDLVLLKMERLLLKPDICSPFYFIQNNICVYKDSWDIFPYNPQVLRPYCSYLMKIIASRPNSPYSGTRQNENVLLILCFRLTVLCLIAAFWLWEHFFTSKTFYQNRSEEVNHQYPLHRMSIIMVNKNNDWKVGHFVLKNVFFKDFVLINKYDEGKNHAAL